MALCFATNNEHKLEEVKALLPKNYPLLSLKDIDCITDIPETQETLQGNAYQKAFYVNRHFGVDCFADDTGLEVKSLGGAPGVYSARYAGPERDENANCSKLLQDLKGKTDRTASFRTVICLIQNGKTYYFEGAISGFIELEMKGSNGFGYDPLFKPMAESRTFAQMTQLEKNQMSHRGAAIRKLVQFLRSED